MNFEHFIIPAKIKTILDQDSKKEKILVRFPPEPSGYLHIGHIKALYINACIWKKYGGKLIIRMDDTNPLLESEEYEKAILSDLIQLGIPMDNISYTSQYFDMLLNMADSLIQTNKAYVDLSDLETIKYERSKGIDSIYRNNSTDKNIYLWNEMKLGSVKGCVRMKLNMTDKNYAMRDFSIYRSISVHHHKTHDKYLVYPTYDFACPILDSIEGITHVFRSIEYNERDEQGNYLLDIMNLRKPKLFHYGKLNITGSILSKRLIKKAIHEGLFDGWDDSRLYTFRGLLKRGMSISGLEQIMKETGYSVHDINLEPSILWNINKKIIDKISTRFTVISSNAILIPVKLNTNHIFDFTNHKSIDRFSRNKSLGQRYITYSPNLYISFQDYNSLIPDELLSLVNFINVTFNNNTFTSNFDTDHRHTSKKLLWVPQNFINVHITSFHNNCKIITSYFGEPDLSSVNIGDYIQLLKMNYYMCTYVDSTSIHLIELP